MRTPTWLAGLASVAVLAGALAALTGCEKDKDGSGASRYLEDNPYRSDIKAVLYIEPLDDLVLAHGGDPADLIGTEVRLRVRGGQMPYGNWELLGLTHELGIMSNTSRPVGTFRVTQDIWDAGRFPISITDRAGNIARIEIRVVDQTPDP